MNQFEWYQNLEKPSFAPPAYLFGIVWGILYPIIFISFGYIGYLYFKKRIPIGVVLPFIINLVANLLFSPIQFVLRNNILAAVDVTIVVISLVWAITKIYPYSKWVAYAQIPYLVWGLFAAILQYSVVYLNNF